MKNKEYNFKELCDNNRRSNGLSVRVPEGKKKDNGAKTYWKK